MSARIPKSTGYRLPRGWDEKKVRRVLRHYEKQSQVAAVKEDEAAYHKRTVTMMGVPVRLVPLVRKLIADHAG